MEPEIGYEDGSDTDLVSLQSQLVKQKCIPPAQNDKCRDAEEHPSAFGLSNNESETAMSAFKTSKDDSDTVSGQGRTSSEPKAPSCWSQYARLKKYMPTGDNSNVINYQEPMISYNNFDTSVGNAPTIGLCRSETEQVVVSSSSRAAAAPPAPIAAPPAAALAVMVVVWNHLNLSPCRRNHQRG